MIGRWRLMLGIRQEFGVVFRCGDDGGY